MEPRKNIRKRNKKVNYTQTGRHAYKGKKRKLNKKKVVFLAIIFIVLIILIVKLFKKDKTVETSSDQNNEQVSVVNENSLNTEEESKPQQEEPEINTKIEITDWRLTLANFENILPKDFTVEVANIDDTRQFDARAVKYLRDMINALKIDGNTKIWCQSTYRSVKRQKELYDASVQKYLKQGKTQEEGTSLH